jgi:hypothetical protein
LWEQYREARNRLDATLDLLSRTLDLREQLQWSLDLDDMLEDVRRLRRAVEQHAKHLPPERK